MTTFDKYLKAVMERAQNEAREDSSTTVEAHHLLLAIAGEEDPATRQVLELFGLNQQTIRDALELEFTHSLNVVGVSHQAYDLPRPSRLSVHIGMGASAKLAIERCLDVKSPKQTMRPSHLLLGVLSARVGTVSRALAFAGVDQDNLIARVRQTLVPDRD